MTPLVLLPGMMCDARLFHYQIAALSGTVPILTAPSGTQHTMAAQAEEVLSYAPPRFALAGLSMGGILAMEILRQAPDRVLALALMDTNPLAEQDEVKARRAPQIETVRTGGLRQVMAEAMIPNYLSPSTPPGHLPELCMDMALHLGPKVFINQSLALRDRVDQTETLRAFKGPALVLCGRDDIPCPLSRHELMHELMPQSEFEIVDNAGHLPTLERPRKTTAALTRWLEKI